MGDREIISEKREKEREEGGRGGKGVVGGGLKERKFEREYQREFMSCCVDVVVGVMKVCVRKRAPPSPQL